MRLIWCLIVALGSTAIAQPQAALQDLLKSDLPEPTLAQPVADLLGAAYLSEDEKKDLRIFHGVWATADLDTPARRARAALITGAYNDPVFAQNDAPLLDRAEAAVMRGEFNEAITMLNGEQTKGLRIHRLRAQALAGLGRNDQIDATLKPIFDAVGGPPIESAEDVVEAVRGFQVRFRALGPKADQAGDYKYLMGMLARARETIDRLYWPAMLEEVRLLASKDNEPEAAQAVETLLTLNPRCAEAWAVSGEIAVMYFDFGKAEETAKRLDELARLDGRDDFRSPTASAILAKVRLRQNDAKIAIEELEPSLKDFPRSPTLLALSAATIAGTFDKDATTKALAAFDAAYPHSPDALLEVGRTLADRRQYADAAAYLNLASARAPHRPEPLVELGLLEVQFGRDALARAALERAAALDPFNVRVSNSLTLVRELASWTTLETPHFLVRFKPGVDEILAREMLDPLEAMYARVTGSARGGIDYQPPLAADLPNGGKTMIELMPDHRWFSVRVTGLAKVHTMAASTGPVIAFEAPRTGPNHLVGPYDWLRVIRHEYTHTVTLSRTRNRLPHWFTEASAQYLEDAPRDWNTVQLLARVVQSDQLFDLDQINVAFARPRKPTDRAQAYAQGHLMYEFIVETWGAKAPLDLMDRYAAGDTEGEAFGRVLSVSREEFLDRFRGWANDTLVAWGMKVRAGVPDLATLLNDRAGEGGKPPEVTPELVQELLAAHPEHPELLSLAVNQQIRANRGKPTAEMVPLLERLAKARPVDPTAHKHLARLYLDGAVAGKTAADAIPHLEFLDVREQGSNAMAMEISRQYATAGMWDRAWTSALRAVGMAPYEAGPREWAATVAIKRSDWEAAQWQLSALARLEPSRAIHTQRLDALKKLRPSEAPR